MPAVRLHDGAAKWATQAASRSRKRRPFGKPHLLDRGHHSTFVCCVDRLDEPDLPVVGSLRCERQAGRPWWPCLHHGARCTVYVAQPVGRSACDASSVRLAGLGQSSTVLWEDSAGFGSRGEAMDRRTQTARSFLDGRCNASLQKGKGAMRAPHCLHTDWTHRCHICAGTGRSATAASTLSSP